jgi:hypothetical protein
VAVKYRVQGQAKSTTNRVKYTGYRARRYLQQTGSNIQDTGPGDIYNKPGQIYRVQGQAISTTNRVKYRVQGLTITMSITGPDEINQSINHAVLSTLHTVNSIQISDATYMDGSMDGNSVM